MEISELTRQDILDMLRVGNISWSGRLNDDAFLARIFDLKALPSYDGRFRDAAGDIHQHRVNNHDWENDGVFDDPRFQLMTCPDDVFLLFLCETLHPAVRKDIEVTVQLKDSYNQLLKADGWELYERTSISGRPVFAARRLLVDTQPGLTAVKNVATILDADYVSQQITRMEASSDSDPELAIGTAKEFIETVCKTILTERGVRFDPKQEFPKLVRQTLKELKLVPDNIPDKAKAAGTIRVLLNNLATIANGMAEIRNLFGTGHGKEAKTKGLQTRHARLAVGAASTLGVFLFETHREKNAW